MGSQIGARLGRPVIGAIIGSVARSALRMAIDHWGKQALIDPACGDYFENGMNGLKSIAPNPTNLNPTEFEWWNGLVEVTQSTASYSEFRVEYFDYC